MRILGLPPYSPEFAPVELVFGLIKSHIRNKREKCKIDYSKESGLEAILSGLKFLTTTWIYKMWKRSISVIRERIWDVNSEINERLIFAYNT